MRQLFCRIAFFVMNEPCVRVGVVSAPVIEFSLEGIYATDDVAVVTGRHSARVSESGLGVEWEGRVYNELEFRPTSPAGDSFELKDVTIGVNFHWERQENQRFKGALRLIARDGRLTAVNVVGVETYLTSVISSEMSAKASLPLLRAHAVISRSWLLAQMDRSLRDGATGGAGMTESVSRRIKWYDRDDHKDFDVCADDHCQRYQGIVRVSTFTAASAVADTRGEVLMAGGRLADARFSKCCGGKMEEFQYCWEDAPHSYLRGLRDDVAQEPGPDLRDESAARGWIESSPEAFCNTSDTRILAQVLNNYDRETADFYRWEVEYSREELAAIVKDRSGMDFGDIIDLVPVKRGVSGRIYEIEIRGTKRAMTIGKELEIRRTLSRSHLYSSAFVVDRHSLDADGIPARFTLRGAGWGHGVGLCQIGAAVMGDRGYRYNEILHHYYPGAEIKKLY